MNARGGRMKTRAASAAALLLLIALLVSCFGYKNEAAMLASTLAKDHAVVALADVGQGECVIILAGDSTVMIDSGDASKTSRRSVLSFLKECGITKIDYLFVSHPHADHIGGMRAVVENCEIGVIVFPEIDDSLQPTSKIYFELLQAIDASGVAVETAKIGDYYDLALGGLTVLSAGGYKDLNNCSVVLLYRYGGTEFLLTGDAEKAVERDILAGGADIESEVLIAGHHGSNTSTTKDFLDAVSPLYLAISCGADNRYGHPHKEVLERAQAAGAVIYRTDVDGTIVFASDGQTVAAYAENRKAEWSAILLG